MSPYNVSIMESGSFRSVNGEMRKLVCQLTFTKKQEGGGGGE